MWHQQIERVAALADRVRRSLYELVASSAPHDVSRDQAAGRLGIRRGLAAFHLDRLVELGLLETSYRRPPGVGGPGAGRPTKFYRRSHSQIDVSLPPRRYELMAAFLAEGASAEALALTRAREAARRFGSDLGAAQLARKGGALGVLRDAGFEPIRRGRQEIILRNCPFDAVATAHKDTICHINLALHEGLVDGLGPTSLKAVLSPEPGRCCVKYQADAVTTNSARS